MRTEESYKRELGKLRQAHHIAYTVREWERMARLCKKIIRVLDALALHYPQWKDDHNDMGYMRLPTSPPQTNRAAQASEK